MTVLRTASVVIRKLSIWEKPVFLPIDGPIWVVYLEVPVDRMAVAPGVRYVKVEGNTVRPGELNISTRLDANFAAAGVPDTIVENLATGAGNQVEICCITANTDDGDDSKEESAEAEESLGWMIHGRLRASREC